MLRLACEYDICEVPGAESTQRADRLQLTLLEQTTLAFLDLSLLKIGRCDLKTLGLSLLEPLLPAALQPEPVAEFGPLFRLGKQSLQVLT